MDAALTPEPMQFDWLASVMTVTEVAGAAHVTPKTVPQHIRRPDPAASARTAHLRRRRRGDRVRDELDRRAELLADGPAPRRT